MPSKSKKQHNLMEAVAHNKAFAKKVGIPQSVGKDFAEADKGKSFKQGGVNMKKKSVNPAMAIMAARAMRRPALDVNPTRPVAPVMPAVNPMAGAPTMPGMKKGGETMKSDYKEDTKMDVAQDKAMIKKAFKQHDMQEHKGGTGTKLALKKGGMSKKCGYADGGRTAVRGVHPVQKQAKRGAEIVKMASGGYTKSADGIAVRGKTKGKMC
tara:strand:- start:377 stop:1006 length:630 start_codon:yes stop_codon:yes gene_type:complete